MNSDFLKSEVEYRRSRDRQLMAAGRAGRSRSSWLRRVAAAEKAVR